MSIFYAARFERAFPVSLLAFERLANLAHLEPIEATTQVLQQVCGVKKPTEQDILYLLDRFKSASEKAEQSAKPSDNSDPLEYSEQPSRSLGSSFYQFTRSLDISRVLLWLSGWDYQKAEYLYSSVDRDDAMQLVEDFLRLQDEKNTYQFEAVLYGFGGHYKNDDSGEDSLDMTGMDAESIMQMIGG